MPARDLTGTSGMRQKPSERRWVTQHVEVCLGRVRRDRFQENWTALPTVSKEPEPEIGARAIVGGRAKRSEPARSPRE